MEFEITIYLKYIFYSNKNFTSPIICYKFNLICFNSFESLAGLFDDVVVAVAAVDYNSDCY